MEIKSLGIQSQHYFHEIIYESIPFSFAADSNCNCFRLFFLVQAEIQS